MKKEKEKYPTGVKYHFACKLYLAGGSFKAKWYKNPSA
jgi:hypothetical protein